jgi:hypothetical protein
MIGRGIRSEGLSSTPIRLAPPDPKKDLVGHAIGRGLSSTPIRLAITPQLRGARGTGSDCSDWWFIVYPIRLAITQLRGTVTGVRSVEVYRLHPLD